MEKLAENGRVASVRTDGTIEHGVPNLGRLRSFLRGMSRLVERKPVESALLQEAEPMLAELVSHDDWLPESCAEASNESYRQYLLFCDAQERFSLVSFVWGPGQSTPIHDHRSWGIIGMLRGSEISEPWKRNNNGGLERAGPDRQLRPKETDCVSPRIGDIHRVTNASKDDVAVSIHLYGANIGAVRRSIYLPDGSVKPFISGYSNTALPYIW